MRYLGLELNLGDAMFSFKLKRGAETEPLGGRQSDTASAQVLRIVETLLLRGAPGLVNLTALLLIGSWMSPAEYGIYSTIIAFTGFLANVTFGPLMFGVVSQHAKLEADGMATEYESAFMVAVFRMALALSTVGSVGVMLGWFHWTFVAASVAIGSYSAIQEVLHARLRLWAYGTAALLQSVIFVVLALTLVRPTATVEKGVLAFASSYAVAFLLSLFLSAPPMSFRSSNRLLVQTIRVGTQYTIGTAMELALYLGLRYLVFLQGTPQQLGTFSFCTDIAQRVIGFLLSAVGFRVIPAAFKASTDHASRGFVKMLRRGAWIGLGLSMSAFLSVLVVRRLELVPALSTELFAPMSFALISLGVVINRLKKIVLDPIAIKSHQSSRIGWGYGIGTPIALAGVALLFPYLESYGAEIGYLVGCILAMMITFVGVRRKT
jgi:hypothetical protein